MIIDAHVHGWPSKQFLGVEYQAIIQQWRTSYFDFYRASAWMDTAGLGTVDDLVERGLVDNLVAAMDHCGVDKAVLANMYPYPLEWNVEMTNQYPNRLCAYATVNPKGGSAAVEDLERQVEQYEAVGVKLGPPYQEFYPNDQEVYPLYEKAMDLKIPVAFHTGWAPGTARLKYARPIHVDDVAVDFPQLTIIGCHMGAGWFHDFALVATKNPNIYADFSGCLEYTSVNEVLSALERLVRLIGADRILLGSDFPLFRLTTYLEIAQGLKVGEEAKRRILGENAKRLFHIQ